MIAVRLPRDIEVRLDHLAKLTGRTKSFYVREAILDHLEDLEDVYLAEERLKTPGATVSLEKLIEEETNKER
ncbi:MAG: TraY domain-containing protein [Oligosphaeraceae bacterium]